MKVVHLETNDLVNPIGYDFSLIEFSWQVEKAKAKYSTITKICIATTADMHEIVYDSGRMLHYRECRYTVNFRVVPRTRYYWRVWIQTEEEEAVSEVAFFETAKDDEKWLASWIGIQDAQNRMPRIYKDFSLEKECQRARVYLCGLGLYEAYLNGKKINDEYLLPGYHSYDHFVEYQTYDISEWVKKGENHFEIILGEGWYKGRFGFDGTYYNLYGAQKKCIVEMHFTFVDGSKQCVFSDASWKANESEIGTNGVYDGEVINETLSIKELKVEGQDKVKEKLTERCNPPIRKTDVIRPVTQKFFPEGYYLYDFGKIITGWAEITATFQKNQKIQLYYGEVLQEEKFYNANLRTAKAEFQYTSMGGTKTIRPHFTYYGFRYLKVEGIEPDQIEEILAYQIMSDIEDTGTITTSNEMVNQLFNNTKQSQKCNFLDIPTDCPQRDERMGWTGDVAVFARTACFHMKSAAFFDHYLKCLKEEQQSLAGAVPFFVPTPKIEPYDGVNPFYVSAGAAVWGDVATILPWTLYQYYGSKKRLQEYFPIMTGWVDYITTRVQKNGKPYLWQKDRQLGDWLALDNGNIHNPIGKTDPDLIASAFYYYAVSLCAKAAKEIKDKNEEKYIQLGKRIREAFLEEYFDKKNGLTVEETQTACAIILFMELYPVEAKEKIKHTLRKLLENNKYHLNTGFVGTPFLCLALSENGMNEIAYTLLLQEDYPSWLYEVKLGATTVWERWNSLLEDGTISGTEMNSLNHYAYGSIADWMYRYMCGFRPSMGEKIKMLIYPLPDERIQEVKGSWHSPYGKYVCEWKKVSFKKIQYYIEIPFNANAELVFSDGEKILLEAGTYFFEKNGFYEKNHIRG